MPTGWFIDANLLVLLIVGATGRHLIPKHKRLRAFLEDDYDRLLQELARTKPPAATAEPTTVGAVRVTPNTLTEASNLLAQHDEPERSQFFRTLRILIENSTETVVASADASRSSAFPRLGLTDAALMEVVSPETPLLTVDLPLYLAVAERDHRAAVNFRHLQPL